MVKVQILLGLVAVSAVGVTGAILVGSTIKPTATTTLPSPRSQIASFANGGPAGPTVGQTLSASDMEVPVTHPADAVLPPTNWTSRVLFKGCGQNVSVRMRVGGKLLLYNSGTVNRYLRAGIPLPPDLSHTVVPKDWRLVTYSTTGIRTVTFTTATCTLWSPKIVITVTS